MSGPIIPPLKLVNLKASLEDVDVIEADVGNIKASLRDSLPAEYSTTATYNKGSTCMHEGKMYKCNSNSVTGTWNPSYWAETRIGNVATLSYTVVSEW